MALVRHNYYVVKYIDIHLQLRSEKEQCKRESQRIKPVTRQRRCHLNQIRALSSVTHNVNETSIKN